MKNETIKLAAGCVLMAAVLAWMAYMAATAGERDAAARAAGAAEADRRIDAVGEAAWVEMKLAEEISQG